jgi:hypothetical protein
LSWVAPVGCPDEASVRGDVQRLLSGSQASAAARADVTHTGDSWRVVVTMNGGERRLEAASCRALADATALIVAMAVDPARVVANRASRGASASAVDAGSGDAAATTATPSPTPTPTPTSTSTSTSTPTSTPTSTEANAHSDGIPVVDIATLPRPHTGVILGSPGHRLWIDGTLAPSWQTTVSCGPHTVQVGSAGAIRDVDVPCGTEINVQP